MSSSMKPGSASKDTAGKFKAGDGISHCDLRRMPSETFKGDNPWPCKTNWLAALNKKN